MNLPEIVSAEQWRTARVEFLAREKEFTRARDAHNAARRRLPMTLVEKDYRLEGPDGPVRLLDLFEDRLQLVVYHFMFDPRWERGCASCSGFADQIGTLYHLNTRGTTFAAVSRARYPQLARFRAEMGWTFPWYSAHDSDFNYDFHVTLDESVRPFEYNYRTRDEFRELGKPVDFEQPFELPGLSCFLRQDEQVFHTYSSYARGTDGIGFTTNLLDLTALGRQEEWEEPKGRTTGFGAQAGSENVRYRDEAGG